MSLATVAGAPRRPTAQSPAAQARVLLVIPTYNEAATIERLLHEVHQQALGVDILVVDDHSPDGTGLLVERLADVLPVRVLHRPAKLGIGSAHKDGFRYAIEHGYTHVMTMDADFAHAPTALRTLLAKAASADVVVGSRYLERGGLVGWRLSRRIITCTAHWLTTHLLRMRYDCTGGLRLYTVESLRRADYQAVTSDGYAFLIELLWQMQAHGCTICETSVVLNFRNQGRSKISREEILKAIGVLCRLGIRSAVRKRSHSSARETEHRSACAPSCQQDWDAYWLRAETKRGTGLYERIAEFYRNQIISRAAARIVSRYFRNERSRHYLHAGCGSGGSDQRMSLDQPCFHALDLSVKALTLNRQRTMAADRRFICGNIFSLPYRAQTMDGIFNFGVMEHFVESDIERILTEFHRVLRPDGYVVLFWPPSFGLSVIVLTSWLWCLNRFRKRPMVLYPDEVCRIKSFRWLRELMGRNRFRLVRAHFGLQDLFTYVVVVAQPAP